jgi:hypothetical protein
MTSDQARSQEQASSIPFDASGEGIEFERFSDRATIRDLVSAMMWEPHILDGGNFFSLAVEGARTFGKTSIANWCRGIAAHRGPNGKRGIVCSYSFQREFTDPDSMHQDIWDTIQPLLEPHLSIKWKSLLWLQRTRGLRFIKWAFRGINGASIGPVSFDFARRENQSFNHNEFVTRLDLWISRLDSNIQFLLITVDEIGGYGQEAIAVQRCVNLAKALRRHKWGSHVRLGLLLLPLPTWLSHIELASDPRRFLTRNPIILEPFSAPETRDLVDGEVGRCDGWSTSEDFSSELYQLSGGFPRLVQYIAHAAAVSVGDSATPKMLTGIHLRNALSDGSIQTIIDYTIHVAGAYRPETPDEVDLLRAITETLPQEITVSGASRELWAEALIGPSTDRQHDRQRAFDRVWNHLLRAHLIVRVAEDHYRFGPEAVLRRLPVIARSISISR